jgi:predicted permease
MDTLVQDIRYGLRQLFRQPSSSIVAVLTLALGIGLSTAIFSVIDATMLRPLPYPEPEQLVTVSPEETMPDGRVSRSGASMEDMRRWQAAGDVFASVAGVASASPGWIVEAAERERIEVSHFTEDYLPMHGVAPLFGRNFSRADTDPGSPLVALLGHDYWQRRYEGRPDVIGQSVRFDTEVATIVGVLPPSFNADTPVATPLRPPASGYSRRGSGMSVYARLRPDVTIEQARERISARMQPRTLPDGQKTSQPRVRIRSRLTNVIAEYRTTVNVLAGAVAMILLLACVNVAGLLLARGAARQTELAVRASIGAGRGRLMRQLLTENGLLSLAGGALGLLLGWLSLEALVANIPLEMPANSPVTLNLKVLGTMVAMLLPTTLLFGLWPAVRFSRVRPQSVLARGGRQRGSALTRRGGQLIIAGEVALAVILVAGAGLMIRSFMRLSSVTLGFNPKGLVVMQALPLERNSAAQLQYYTALLEAVRAIPGITSAGIVDNFALGGNTLVSSVTAADKTSSATVFEVTPGYLETIGATLTAGQFPPDTGDWPALRQALISESGARRLFGGRALGRQFTRAGPVAEVWTVIGVIEDIRHGGPYAMFEGEPQIFVAPTITAFDLNTAMSVVMRPSGSASGLGDQLRRVAQSLGPRVLVERIRTAEELFGERVLTPRRRTVLLGLLGGLGLTLALVGVFGVTGYSVARRTPEIGVRLAFGARPAQVVRTMMRDAVAPIAIGTAVGIAGALLSTRLIESFLFSTEPNDPATLASVAVTLVITGCLAALAPAMRAARVDPMTSLRAE